MDPVVLGSLIEAVAALAAAIIGAYVAIKLKDRELLAKGLIEKRSGDRSARSSRLTWGLAGALIGAALVWSVLRFASLLSFPLFPHAPESTPTMMSITSEPRILFDESHGGLTLDPVRAATLEPTPEIRGYIYAGTFASGVREEYVLESLTDGPITSEILTQYRVLILGGQDGWYSSEEAETILNFVRSGGGLLVLSVGGAGSQSLVTEPLGISYLGAPIASRDHVEWGPWGFKVHVSSSDPLLEGVSDLTANAVPLMDVDGPAEAVLWTNANTWLDSEFVKISNHAHADRCSAGQFAWDSVHLGQSCCVEDSPSGHYSDIVFHRHR